MQSHKRRWKWEKFQTFPPRLKRPDLKNKGKEREMEKEGSDNMGKTRSAKLEIA